MDLSHPAPANEALLPLLLALLTGLSDGVAGWLVLGPPARRWSPSPRYLLAFASGVLLAVVFLDVLPELDLRANAGFLALGFFAFYALEKGLMLHACGEAECEVHTLSPVTMAGMALDNVLDGVGIAVAFAWDPLLGGMVALAVAAHEVPQGMASAAILDQAGWSRRRILAALGGAGALYPVGALLAGVLPPSFWEPALAFVAGDLLYIGAGDLLPEAHRRFNLRVLLALFFGVGFVVLLGRLLGS